ncbi:hypothetical protein PACTADRAFT_4473 [Pachysolen tannophilus NRRL Y-2460]|uniref:Glutathione S-transferase n=1 Tax=Pachysolen tannophilus NRRL Y-2460 TaxID=669874 RepID=A0A1E4TPC7_PACTA|nr:hypothetical protein PACTADRAFT_4473 [Pachysolen tannophilus NRRL Y-2460]
MVGYLVDEKDPKEVALKAPYIKLYTAPTSNGFKISILLELLGLDYYVRPINLATNENKEPWYLELNPNGKIPTLSDVDEKGNKLEIAESGAIMLYLIEKYDKSHKFSYPYGTLNYWKTVECLFFQVSAVGVIQNILFQFNTYTEPDPFATKKFVEELKRLYSILESFLQKNHSNLLLVGDRITIADIGIWTFANNLGSFGIDINEYPSVKQWYDKLKKIDGFQRGLKIFPSE